MMAAKWAVLVGINEYPPGNKRVDRNGNPLRFTDLRGCLNDVNQIEQYLLNSQGFDKSHILKLTSPLQSMDQFPDNRDPTAENIRDTLKSCTTQVKEGDIVYFHYSGHGARIKTLSPEGAKKGRLDECLVPFDVLRGGSFLRDFELVYLLRQIASKGAFLTVTVDCCHSGGTAQRGSDRLVRGIDEVIDNLETDQPLIDHSGQEEEISLRNAVSTLHPKRYALHAACGADEKAYETRKYGEWIGLFTHWLLHSLEEAGSDSTHRMISDNISIKVQDQFFDQKPVFTGKIDHYFMGPESETPRGMGDLKLSNVPTTVQQGATATILGGRAQWVSTGDEFAIFPWNEKGSDTSQRLAVVKATVVKELESEAKFEEVTHNPKFKIESGCRAIRIKKNALIQLIVANTSLYWELDSALRSFEHSAIPLRLSLNRDDRDENLAFYNACYEVEASSNPPGRYHLQLESGQEISFLPDATNPTEILEQAEHVGTFHMIRELRSQEDPGTKNQFEFIAADIETVHHQDVITCTIRNKTQHAVYARILDFDPLWGVEQVMPPPGKLRPRNSLSVDLRMEIPTLCEGKETITDTLKCLITLKPTNFDSLRLPGLDNSGKLPRLRGSRGLDNLLQLLMPPQRHAKAVMKGGFDWVSKELTIETHR